MIGKWVNSFDFGYSSRYSRSAQEACTKYAHMTTISVEETRVESWNEFVLEIEKNEPNEIYWTHDAIYRGQSDRHWGLVPSILRFLPTKSPPEFVLAVEDELLRSFVSGASVHMRSHEWRDDADVDYWWPIMQHHGVPTRILDWTRSPYVAAYFAVVEQPNTDGALWVINLDAVGQALTKRHGITRLDVLKIGGEKLFKDPRNPDDIIFSVSKQLTERMIAQQGVVSICRNVKGCHGTILIELASEYDSNILKKLVIPAHQKSDFLRKLRLMNVTGSVLFPGLDGLGRSALELVKLVTDTIDKNYSFDMDK